MTENRIDDQSTENKHMHVAIVKLNGWPETFDERITEISRNVDHVTLVRPKPNRGRTDVEDIKNATVKNTYPSRGKSVNRLWLHLILFPLHVLQAIIILSVLSFSKVDPPDVIHSLDYILGGMAGAVTSIVTGIPLVVSVRGLVEPRYRNMVDQNDSYIGYINYRLLQIIPKFVFSQGNYVITKADYQREYIRQNYSRSIPFATLPTGVNYDIFDSQKVPQSKFPNTLADIANGTDPNIALFLGRLTEEKGADLLLQNLIQAEDPPSDFHILYVGDFRDNRFEKKLRSMKDDCSVPVTIHDKRIAFEKVPELIANVDCTVLLSGPKHEGVPRVLQESCVLETDVVASDVAGIAGAFSDIDGCYLVDRTVPAELCDAFRKVAISQTHPDRDDVRHKFDMSYNYAQYAEIYKEVADK